MSGAHVPISDETTIDPLEWEIDVPVATHPLILANFGKVVAIATVLMGSLLAFLLVMNGDYDAIAPLAAMSVASGAGLFLLVLVIALVFYRNRMHMRFTVNAAGASASTIDRVAKTARKVTILTGLLTGKPSLAGAGMISTATSDQSIPWHAIARARFDPRRHTIVLANSWRTVLVLFCRDENYQAVARAVSRALSRPAPHHPTMSPLVSFLLRSAMVVIATVPLFQLSHAFGVDSLAPILTMCFALATVWLVPLLAWVVIGMIIYIGGAALLSGPVFPCGFSLYPVHRAFAGDSCAMPALALLGAAYLVWVSIAALRGRTQSALMSD